MKKTRILSRIGLTLLCVAMVCGTTTPAADKYDGPRPPKPDLPYLQHASNLLATEAAEAKPEAGKKDQSLYTINGANASARTPLAEPIFLMMSDKVLPDRLELYRLAVKNGRREITIAKGKNSAKPLHMTVTKLDGKLYRLEAGEPLENGQYSLSPNDSNMVFCFEVY